MVLKTNLSIILGSISESNLPLNQSSEWTVCSSTSFHSVFYEIREVRSTRSNVFTDEWWSDGSAHISDVKVSLCVYLFIACMFVYMFLFFIKRWWWWWLYYVVKIDDVAFFTLLLLGEIKIPLLYNAVFNSTSLPYIEDIQFIFWDVKYIVTSSFLWRSSAQVWRSLYLFNIQGCLWCLSHGKTGRFMEFCHI